MEVCSNDFNQQIPAIEPVQIDTAALVDEKMKMLDTLDDIAVTQQMGANANARAAGGGGGGGGGIGGGGGSARIDDGPKHPLDAKAEQLNCGITAVSHSSKIFKAVTKACKNGAEPPAGIAAQLCGFHYFNETPEVLEV